MARVWSEREIEAIVRDYFVMLEHEQLGITYVKADHWRELIRITGRTKGAIERKHMNISAVMDTLGLPYINGYKPYRNYQRALFNAVEVHLNQRPEFRRLLTGEAGMLQRTVAESISSNSIVFDSAPPQQEAAVKNPPEAIGSIIQRFENPAERDARNRNLGRAGEELVYEYEKNRLQTVGRKDLSERVRWVARDDGDGYGYDILSFKGKGEEAGREIWLEIKTTNGSVSTPFYITRNELRVSEQQPESYLIYRLYDFRKQARAFCLAPPLENHVSLIPTIYRASFWMPSTQ